MSAYRDGFEPCPRCTVTLEDAGSTRACPSCRGLWVAHDVVAEMIQNMLPPTGLLGRLELAVVERAERLACPSCREPMAPTRIHEVELDACIKGHGVWFDAHELAAALHAVTRPGGSPLVPIPEPPSPRAMPRPLPPTSPSTTTFAPAAEQEALPLLLIRELAPREGLAQRFRQSVIKIGRLASAHIRVTDPNVSRMHAIIEVTTEQVQIIDLGSSTGTLVDGSKVNKAELHEGSRVQVGDVVLEVHLDR